MSYETKDETCNIASSITQARSWHELLSHLKPSAVFIFIRDNMQNDFSWSFVRLINGSLGNGKKLI